MKVIQAYRFALDPTLAQERVLRSHAGAARFAWNWGLAKAFTVEIDRAVPHCHARLGSAIGIDLGVKMLLTGVDADGNVLIVKGAKPLRASLRKLRRASRVHSRKTRGSANRRKSAARLARIHAQIANIRTDMLHKATSALAPIAASSAA
jgi:putative transposase